MIFICCFDHCILIPVQRLDQFSLEFWNTHFFHYAQQLFVINPVERYLIVDKTIIYILLTCTELCIIVLSWNIASLVPLPFLNPL